MGGRANKRDGPKGSMNTLDSRPTQSSGPIVGCYPKRGVGVGGRGDQNVEDIQRVAANLLTNKVWGETGVVNIFVGPKGIRWWLNSKFKGGRSTIAG